MKYLLTFILLYTTAFAQSPASKPEWALRREAREEAAWQKEQERMYQRAVENTREIRPRAMVQNLWGVNDPQVTRRTDSAILAVCALTQDELAAWMGPTHKTAPETTDPRRMWWVSLDPQLGAMLREEPAMDSASVAVSIKQILGLPPQQNFPYIVTFWVSPDDLFRPTADPDPTTHFSTANYPAGVAPAHRTWMEDWAGEAYDGDPPYPWTRLGYTYDWGNPDFPVGLSEFVIKPGKLVQVESLGTIWNWYSKQLDSAVVTAIEMSEPQ